MDALLASGFMSTAILSLVHRTLLSLLLGLPQQAPESLSPDRSFHGRVLRKLSTVCVDLACEGTSGWASRSIGTVISSMTGSSSAIIESQVSAMFASFRKISAPNPLKYFASL